MQYKIPVQIENEDPILLTLSLRQLIIIMIGLGISYSIMKSLAPLGTEIALIPAVIVGLIFIIIAIFKYSEMTFVKFVLSFIRLKTNLEDRKWVKGVDSYSLIDMGFVNNLENKIDNKIDLNEKMNKIKNMDENISKI